MSSIVSGESRSLSLLTAGFYQGKYCRDTCRDPDKLQVWAQSQPLADLVTGVSCEEDCRYECMWLTVEEMEVRTEMCWMTLTDDGL